MLGVSESKFPVESNIKLVHNAYAVATIKQKETHEKHNVAYTLFSSFLRKHFYSFGLARKGKKPVFLCDV